MNDIVIDDSHNIACKRPINNMIISSSGDELLRIDMPGIESPVLTTARKKAVNNQLLRFLANYNREDSALNRLVFMTFDFMPFYYLQDFISKALWYYSDWDLMHDRGDFLSVYKAFIEQQRAVIGWHGLYDRKESDYEVNLSFDRLERKIRNNVLMDDHTHSIDDINFHDLSTTEVGIGIIVILLFIKFFLRKK